MDPHETNFQGPAEARYLAFLETIANLRPSLHRYCSRMTGSIFDGEDVVQEALFQAYRMLESFDDSRPLKPWLFRIAHNRCIDFLRRREVREEAETAATEPDWVMPAEPPGPRHRPPSWSSCPNARPASRPGWRWERAWGCRSPPRRPCGWGSWGR